MDGFMFRYLLQVVCLTEVLLFSVSCSHQHCVQTGFGSEMKSGLIVNVRDLGAKGDGTSDDSAAFQKAVDHIAKSIPALLYIPPGNYRLNQRVTLDLTADGLTIRGEGQGVSNLLCDNPDGVIRIRSEKLRGAITVEELSFFAMRQNAGTALDITNRIRGGPGHYRNLIVQNIEMRGYGENSTFYFNRGINAHNLWRPLFLNVIFDGVYYPGMKKLKNFHADDSLIYRPDCGIQTDYCYAPSFQHCYVWCAHTGYRMISEKGTHGPEDGAFYRSFAVQCRVGMDINTPISEPQLVIEACHLNCRDFGIKLNNRKFFHITHNLLYSQTAEEYPYVDIRISGTSYAGVVSQNIFQDPAKTNYKHLPAAVNVEHVMMQFGHKCRNITITGNVFNAKGRSIEIAGNPETFIIKDNQYANPQTLKTDITTNIR